MLKLKISIGKLVLFAKTSPFNPLTLKAIIEKLPIKAKALRWGEEVYFYVPFSMGQEHTAIEVNLGDIVF